MQGNVSREEANLAKSQKAMIALSRSCQCCIFIFYWPNSMFDTF